MPNHEREANPYAAPCPFTAEGPVFHPTEFSIRLMRKSWLYRQFAVSGPIPAVVEYNGWGLGYEFIRVNGVVAAKATGRLGLAPLFTFFIATPSASAPVCVEVKSALALCVTGLRLSVNGQLLYIEGAW